MKILHILSSAGTFVANAETGEHLLEQSLIADDCPEYKNIVQFDLQERILFWTRQGFPSELCRANIDILDLGYWNLPTVAGQPEHYEPAGADWRAELVSRHTEPRRYPTVRFWHYLNGGFVRITLRPGQTLAWSKFEHTEEGNSWVSDIWEYAERGVVYTWANGGRDCDGPIVRSGELFCPFDKLNLPTPEASDRTYAAWVETAPTVVNDTFARQMGY